MAICTSDPEANNGGCTEPHVSHVLSSRLSSRPMTWSKETLVKLAPMLACGGEVELRREQPQTQKLLLVRAAKAAVYTFHNATFALDPDTVGTLQPISTGKRPQLYEILRDISDYKAF